MNSGTSLKPSSPASTILSTSLSIRHLIQAANIADAALGIHFLARRKRSMIESGSSIAIRRQKASMKRFEPCNCSASRAAAVSRSARTRSFSASSFGVFFVMSSLLPVGIVALPPEPCSGALCTSSRKFYAQIGLDLFGRCISRHSCLPSKTLVASCLVQLFNALSFYGMIAAS